MTDRLKGLPLLCNRYPDLVHDEAPTEKIIKDFFHPVVSFILPPPSFCTDLKLLGDPLEKDKRKDIRTISYRDPF